MTKWAAQRNGAPGIKDLRGGAVLGEIGVAGADVAPTTTTTVAGTTYTVLNPAFAQGPQGRLLYNVVRTATASAELKAIFQPGGFICTQPERADRAVRRHAARHRHHRDELLRPAVLTVCLPGRRAAPRRPVHL